MRHRRDQLMVCRNGISLCLDLMQYIPPQIIDALSDLRQFIISAYCDLVIQISRFKQAQIIPQIYHIR